MKKEIFDQLYDNWYKETCLYSNTNKIFENENYLKIINSGINVVPFIIEKLREEKENNSYTFLVCAFQEICPDVITIEGYVSTIDLVNKWLEITDDIIDI